MDGLDDFVTKWAGAKGSERAQSQQFLLELCDALEVDRPDPANIGGYGFEYAVKKTGRATTDTTGFIDFYKRGCFVLESKQSRQGDGKKAQPDLFNASDDTQREGRSGRAWDALMMNAQRQAIDYVHRLPAGHENPPFVIVCDVGHCLEFFADFSGLGRYRQFPDRQGFRVYLEDLRKTEVAERIRAIWTEPQTLDPTARSARVTREIARRLAEVSKAMEAKKADPEQVAMFLMRCLFTMFAEDVGLLPKASFKELLEKCENDPSKFQPMVQQMWQAMNTGGFAYAIEQKVRRFNGNLFADAQVMPLGQEEIGELRAAASANWREVEPAIFGTLLEQALDPKERKKLGAHYTPRAYVERLVNATVIEPLEDEWNNVRATADRLRAGDPGKKKKPNAKAALKAVQQFHDKLCATRVLDPACGTGNFLYVSFELMKRLEGEVLEALADLGGQEMLSELEGHTVDPHLFLGLEINPRAAAIAELVLWIGYLQWYFRTLEGAPSEPILKAFRNIEHRDAVLTWDSYPVPNVVEGVETYRNSHKPVWPEAEYIVGNPPFIGGKDVRSRMGDGYIEALWNVHKHMNQSADFVMYWWDRCAELLTQKGTKLQRFGLVTTNSITQVFQRRVTERHLNAKKPVSLLLAIPDHPWTKATKDSAAVRIAMTVAKAGRHEGVLSEVSSESGLDTDEPMIQLHRRTGKINADLSIGVDLNSVLDLLANKGLGYRGMQLIGSGFIVTSEEAKHLGLGKRVGLEKQIRPYRNGRDLTSMPRGVMVIDLFGLSQDQVREKYPEVYQHILQTVKPERNQNNRATYRDNWWIFGEPRKELRPALQQLPRYIATVETTKHRVFQFLEVEILPDNRLVCMALSTGYHLGVLSSKIHVTWALATGGTLEDRPIYTKSLGFDPFPFPDTDEVRQERIGEIAENMDKLRKNQQAANPGLTLTQMYNVLEKLRSGEALTPAEVDICDKGLVHILKEYHDDLNAAVLAAYGWPEGLSDEEILERLVALNGKRAKEEARGDVKWLRPEYQIPRFGSPRQKAEQFELLPDEKVAVAASGKTAFPTGEVEQTAAVMAAMAHAEGPVSAAGLATAFTGRGVQSRIALTLVALARMGVISREGDGRYSLRRAA